MLIGLRFSMVPRLLRRPLKVRVSFKQTSNSNDPQYGFSPPGPPCPRRKTMSGFPSPRKHREKRESLAWIAEHRRVTKKHLIVSSPMSDNNHKAGLRRLGRAVRVNGMFENVLRNADSWIDRSPMERLWAPHRMWPN